MNFVRGLAPTEAIGIGQIALAPEIKELYALDPTKMITGKNGKAFPSTFPIFDGAKVLEEVRDGLSQYNLRFLGFITEEADENGQGDIHRLSEYKGLYVKYKDQTYKIPK
jgi:hypothetical protein